MKKETKLGHCPVRGWGHHCQSHFFLMKSYPYNYIYFAYAQWLYCPRNTNNMGLSTGHVQNFVTSFQLVVYIEMLALSLYL